MEMFLHLFQSFFIVLMLYSPRVHAWHEPYPLSAAHGSCNGYITIITLAYARTGLILKDISKNTDLGDHELSVYDSTKYAYYLMFKV